MTEHEEDAFSRYLVTPFTVTLRDNSSAFFQTSVIFPRLKPGLIEKNVFGAMTEERVKLCPDMM